VFLRVVAVAGGAMFTARTANFLMHVQRGRTAVGTSRCNAARSDFAEFLGPRNLGPEPSNL
jgi:hypothetical protein